MLAYHPDDASAATTAFSSYMLHGESRKALAMLDKLMVTAGPDPYFHVQRAYLLLALNDFAGARAAADQALALEPELTPARWSRVDIALQRKDFAAAGNELSELVALGEADAETLREMPEYAEFVASEHYAKLLAATPPPEPD